MGWVRRRSRVVLCLQDACPAPWWLPRNPSCPSLQRLAAPSVALHSRADARPRKFGPANQPLGPATEVVAGPDFSLGGATGRLGSEPDNWLRRRVMGSTPPSIPRLSLDDSTDAVHQSRCCRAAATGEL